MPHLRDWVFARKTVQLLSLAGFVALFVASRLAAGGAAIDLPFQLDPLIVVASSIASRTIVVGSALALATVVLTLVFGRAWCGWLCPLGTTFDLLPSRSWRRAVAVPESWRGIKYVLLVVVLVAAVLGSQTPMFLDPLAILTRTLGAAVWPGVDQLVTAIEGLASQVGLDGPVSSFDSLVRPALLPVDPLSYEDGPIFGALFVGLVALNWFAPRFWCRYLCPLGGLLGVISRVALVRRTTPAACGDCRLCAMRCPTGTIDRAHDNASDPAECTVCMECVRSCPRGLSGFRRVVAAPQGRPYDPSRRSVLVGIGAAVAGIMLFRADLLAKRESPFLLRPPGSREANADPVALTACTRCNACVRVCPTGAIQPAVLQAGLEGFATPVIVPRLGYCDYSCNACGLVCPTQAIPALDLPLKQRQVIGRAYIDQNRCLVWSDNTQCVVCQEMCPVPDKAIKLEVRQVQASDGTTPTLQFPRVDRDLCIGCGTCEYRCPVSGDAAIRVYVPGLPAAL